MKYKIKINDKEYDIKGNALGGFKEMRGSERDVVLIEFDISFDAFQKIGMVDNVNWFLVEYDDNDKVVATYDQSSYNLVCDKIIHSDNTVGLYMGKPTDMELMQEEINDLLG